MSNASEWVNRILLACQDEPMATDEILEKLEKTIGQGDKAMIRVQAIVDYIDAELVERRGGPRMRELWATVTDYLEKLQEARAAA